MAGMSVHDISYTLTVEDGNDEHIEAKQTLGKYFTMQADVRPIWMPHILINEAEIWRYNRKTMIRMKANTFDFGIVGAVNEQICD